MSTSQIYKTPKRKCSRCLYDSQLTEKVSPRIWPPAGGYLCPDCLVPAAIENQSRVNEEDAVCEHGIPLRVVCLDCQPDRVMIEPERKRSENVVAYLAPKSDKPKKPISFECPDCGEINFVQVNIDMGYCNKCEWWTGDPVMSQVPKEQRG